LKTLLEAGLIERSVLRCIPGFCAAVAWGIFLHFDEFFVAGFWPEIEPIKAGMLFFKWAAEKSKWR